MVRLNSIRPSPNKARATTLIEVLIALMLLSMVLGAIYYIFRGGMKGSDETIKNLIINENAQRIIDYLANDIREANDIDPAIPAFVAYDTKPETLPVGPNATTITDKLILRKAVYDFLSPKPQQCKYKQIEYEVEKFDPRPSPRILNWALKRKEFDCDAQGNQLPGTPKAKDIVKTGLESFVFYRLNPPPDTPSSGEGATIYCSFLMGRNEKDPVDPSNPNRNRFTNRVESAFKIRGGVSK